MNILVVGGAGYIGGAVTDILQKSNPDWDVELHYCKPNQVLHKPWKDSPTQDFFNFQGKDYFSEVENLGIAVKALRKHFAVPAGSLIRTLDKYCKQGNKDQQKSAIKIIEAELDTYARANENPEYSSEIISQVITVNKAEQGALTNSSELKQALNSESSEILLRSIKAIEKLEDKGFAHEILSNLVLDERQDVSEASKEVLRSLMRPSSGE